MSASRKLSETTSLRIVKAAHTLVWAFFAGCIVALPIFAFRRSLGVAVLLIAIVSLEVLVLAVNRLRCPLTDIAGRYTTDRAENFDIYLPLWLARYNKHIFGALFIAGLFCTAIIWRG
jgi:hypothetical protein